MSPLGPSRHLLRLRKGGRCRGDPELHEDLWVHVLGRGQPGHVISRPELRLLHPRIWPRSECRPILLGSLQKAVSNLLADLQVVQNFDQHHPGDEEDLTLERESDGV